MLSSSQRLRKQSLAVSTGAQSLFKKREEGTVVQPLGQQARASQTPVQKSDSARRDYAKAQQQSVEMMTSQHMAPELHQESHSRTRAMTARKRSVEKISQTAQLKEESSRNNQRPEYASTLRKATKSYQMKIAQSQSTPGTAQPSTTTTVQASSSTHGYVGP